MPGFVAPLHLNDDMDEWIADLVAKGYEKPITRKNVFKPRADFD
jgi:hypothetical protein